MREKTSHWEMIPDAMSFLYTFTISKFFVKKDQNIAKTFPR